MTVPSPISHLIKKFALIQTTTGSLFVKFVMANIIAQRLAKKPDLEVFWLIIQYRNLV